MWKKILLLFLLWRILLFIFAFIGGLLLPFTPRFPYSDVFLIPSGLPQWLWTFANFDGVHYLTISQQGYAAQFTQVFFPVYPLILRLINIIFPINPVLTGITLSSLFFLLCLFTFKNLLALDYKINIWWTVLFLMFFPTSFFFGSIYTESFFLLLIFLSFYFARKKNWWLAAIIGSLASATRFIGIFLLPALLWEYHQLQIQNTKYKIQNTLLHILHSPILYILPLGLFSYLAYLQKTFGDWLYFWHAQPVFGAQREGSSIILLPQVIWRYIKILTTLAPASETFWISFLELFSTTIAIFLLLKAHKNKIRTSYLIFSWPSLILPTLTGTFSSMPRYILVLFPMYIALAMLKSDRIKILLLTFSVMLLTALTILFIRGHWVS